MGAVRSSVPSSLSIRANSCDHCIRVHDVLENLAAEDRVSGTACHREP